MDEQIRQFREARERASHAAQDFLAANPRSFGVVVVGTGLSIHRDQNGKERLLPNSTRGRHVYPAD